MKFWLLLFVSVSVAYGQVPRSKHIWIVTEENHSYESVIGNPDMPYYNALAQTYGLATQYYAPRHNSLSALMWLVAGQSVTTNNNTTQCFDVNNVVRQLLARGLTWKSYQRDLLYPGFEGVSSGGYVRRHNPLIDFTDSCMPDQKINSVPFTQLSEDIANHATPNYAYITPNLEEDAHDGSLAQSDQWLKEELPAILALPEFGPGGDGLMFIVWDEGGLSNDNRCSARLASGCGGRAATLVIGPQVKPHFQSQVTYTHSNLLRTVCDAMQLISCPGEGAVAGPMDDFFNTVSISKPFDGAVVASPAHIQASASNSSSVIAMQIYVDGVLKYQEKTATLDAAVPMTTGLHNVVVQSWDTAGGIHKSAIAVRVGTNAVVVSAPAPNTVVSAPVLVTAEANGPSLVSTMSLSVDGSTTHVVSGDSINTSLTLPLGPHVLKIQSTDQAGTTKTNKFAVTVAKPTATILSPVPDATLYSPISLWALTQDPSRVNAVKVYVDDVLYREFTGDGVKAPLPIPIPGKHRLVFQAWNRAGEIYNAAMSMNICAVKIAISSPAQGSVLVSPVHFMAQAPNNSPIYAMQVYVDATLVYSTNGKTIDASLPITGGPHHIVVKAWDDGGGTWTSAVDMAVK